jgi:hypothetical protein
MPFPQIPPKAPLPQRPPAQLMFSGHARPQPLQFFGSTLISAQTLLQHFSPVPQQDREAEPQTWVLRQQAPLITV